MAVDVLHFATTPALAVVDLTHRVSDGPAHQQQENLIFRDFMTCGSRRRCPKTHTKTPPINQQTDKHRHTKKIGTWALEFMCVSASIQFFVRRCCCCRRGNAGEFSFSKQSESRPLPLTEAASKSRSFSCFLLLVCLQTVYVDAVQIA